MKAKDIFQYTLGAIIVIGFFGLLALLIYQGVPEQNNDILTLVIGALLSAFSYVVGYFYGSSKGSSEKTELLNKPKE